ncbi:transcription repressor NadR [Massilimicrobiota sp. An80]|uniref:transcription repressor NadR n=1 Tax=Massilimicrobiota sp. An80 TaxID=1965658 RepID=UPI000B441F40|nr:transcription repressor NadR [Massilimicrobiota sp. An80]OUN32314.1 transcription repressor NadR [Massilimicrobiota sp. An80]
MDRKEKIIEEIKKSDKPISASTLAKKLGVSRQIIVGDVALIRASGTNIIATPRGYILDSKQQNQTYTIAVNHSQEQMADELYTIVDSGGCAIDVIVDHPVYGQLTGKLHLSSRYDVDQFIKKVNNNQAKPLSQLTDGLHLHTIQCPNEDTYQRIVSALDEKGYLFKKEI